MLAGMKRLLVVKDMEPCSLSGILLPGFLPFLPAFIASSV